MKTKSLLVFLLCFAVPTSVAVGRTAPKTQPTPKPQEAQKTSAGFAEMNGEGNPIQSVKGKTLNRLEIQKSKESQVVFEGLKPEAIEVGLNNVLLIGEPSYETLGDNKTRVKIDWHSISVQSEKTKAMSKKLDSPLESQFLVTSDTKKVEPGTLVTIKGNFEKLTQTFLALKEELDKDNGGPRHLVEKAAEEKDEEKARESSDFTPSGTNSAGISGDTGSSSSDLGDYNANLVTSAWVNCTPRVSSLEGVIYIQHKEVTSNEDGSIASSGECLDTGEKITAQTLRGEAESGCKNVYDFGNEIVYQQFKQIATYDGNEILVRDCTNDFTAGLPMGATSEDCSYEHDFVAHISTKQEKLYYMDGPAQIFITPCVNSDSAYAHFNTDTGCEPIIDDIKHLYFPQERIAFLLESGQIEFATDECRPSAVAGYTLLEAFCENKYEHDFTAGQSYYRTYDYFVDENGQSVQVSECARSTSINFPHSFDNLACAVRNDDPALQTYWLSTTIIQTPDDGIVTIAPCQERGMPTPYIAQDGPQIQETFYTSGSWTTPARVSQFSYDLWAGGGGGSGAPDVAGSGGGGGGNYALNVFRATSPGLIVPYTIGAGGAGGAIGKTGGASSIDSITLYGGGGGGSASTGGAAGGPNAGKGGDGCYVINLIQQLSSPAQNGGSSNKGEPGGLGTGVGMNFFPTSFNGGGGGASMGPGGNGAPWNGVGKAALANSGAGGGGGGYGGGAGGGGGINIRYLTTIYKRGDGTIYDPAVVVQ